MSVLLWLGAIGIVPSMIYGFTGKKGVAIPGDDYAGEEYGERAYMRVPRQPTQTQRLETTSW